MSSEALNEACKIAGSQTNLVRRILAICPDSKIMPPAIWAWVKSGRADRPPAEYVLPIAQAVDWQITPHQLRTDLYPHPCDGMPKPEHISNECVMLRPMPIVNEHVGPASGVVEHLTPPSIEDFNAAQLVSARMDAMHSALDNVQQIEETD